MNICKVEGCNNPIRAKGLCNKHWQRQRKYGDSSVVILKPLPKKCEVPGCDNKPKARWSGKALCNKHYLRIWSYGSVEEREHAFSQWSLCSVEGCDKPARSPGGKMCEMHYYRVRRTGSTEIDTERKGYTLTSHGYISVYDKEHPLSFKGRVYEHRKILFDKIGWGPHPCYWCGAKVDWKPGEKTSKGSLVVDHLNGNKKDNSAGNLIPSCHRCNSMRGLFQSWVIEHGEDAIRLLILQWKNNIRDKGARELGQLRMFG